MRYVKLFFILVVSVLLIGTISANAEDGVPGTPFQNLQNQIDNHETRIGDVETRLDALGQSQSVRVCDANGNMLGVLLGHTLTSSDSTIQVFVPSINKIVEFALRQGSIQTSLMIYYSETGCTGDAYIDSYFINDLIFRGYGGNSGTLTQVYTCDTSTEVEVAVQSHAIWGGCTDEYQASFKGLPLTVLPNGVLPLLPPDYARVAIPFQYQCE